MEKVHKEWTQIYKQVWTKEEHNKTIKIEIPIQTLERKLYIQEDWQVKTKLKVVQNQNFRSKHEVTSDTVSRKICTVYRTDILCSKLNGKWLLGWPIGGFPFSQGPYHCATKVGRSFGIEILDAHCKACTLVALMEKPGYGIITHLNEMLILPWLLVDIAIGSYYDRSRPKYD